MNEQQRQHYLQAFGIESYMPRWILPGAAESAECEAGPLTGEVPPPDSGEPLADAAPARKTAPRLLDTESAEPAPRQARETAGPLQSAARPHRFLLSAWRIGDGLMVLDSRRPGQGLPVEQLLLSICRALGYRLAALPAPETLRWPLVRGGATPQTGTDSGVADARAMVEAYLSARHEKQPITALLLMGADAALHGLPPDLVEPLARGGKGAMAALAGKSFPVGFPLDAARSPASEAIVLPSLAALLKQPALKKPTWKAIQHLRVSG